MVKQDKSTTGFNISTHPAPKITGQGDRMSGLFVHCAILC